MSQFSAASAVVCSAMYATLGTFAYQYLESCPEPQNHAKAIPFLITGWQTSDVIRFHTKPLLLKLEGSIRMHHTKCMGFVCIVSAFVLTLDILLLFRPLYS